MTEIASSDSGYSVKINGRYVCPTRRSGALVRTGTMSAFLELVSDDSCEHAQDGYCQDPDGDHLVTDGDGGRWRSAAGDRRDGRWSARGHLRRLVLWQHARTSDCAAASATRRRRRRRRRHLGPVHGHVHQLCGQMARRVRHKSVPTAALARSPLPRIRLRAPMPRSATRAARGPTRRRNLRLRVGSRPRWRVSGHVGGSGRPDGGRLRLGCGLRAAIVGGMPPAAGFKNWAAASGAATPTTSRSTSCSSCRTLPTCRRIRRLPHPLRVRGAQQENDGSIEVEGALSSCRTLWARWPRWPPTCPSTPPTMSLALRRFLRRWCPQGWPRRPCAPPCVLKWPWFRAMRSWPPTRWSTGRGRLLLSRGAARGRQMPEAPTADATHLLHLYGAQTTDAHVYLSTTTGLDGGEPEHAARLARVGGRSPSGYQRNFVATDTLPILRPAPQNRAPWRVPSKRAMRSWAVT